MLTVIGYIAGIVAIILLLELLTLPDWIRSSLRGRLSREALERKVTELESRLADLERKVEGA